MCILHLLLHLLCLRLLLHIQVIGKAVGSLVAIGKSIVLSRSLQKPLNDMFRVLNSKKKTQLIAKQESPSYKVDKTTEIYRHLKTYREKTQKLRIAWKRHDTNYMKW